MAPLARNVALHVKSVRVVRERGPLGLTAAEVTGCCVPAGESFSSPGCASTMTVTPAPLSGRQTLISLIACFLLERRQGLLDDMVQAHDNHMTGLMRRARHAAEADARQLRQAAEAGLITLIDTGEAVFIGDREESVAGCANGSVPIVSKARCCMPRRRRQ